jgi:hypothetical protein
VNRLFANVEKARKSQLIATNLWLKWTLAIPTFFSPVLSHDDLHGADGLLCDGGRDGSGVGRSVRMLPEVVNHSL